MPRAKKSPRQIAEEVEAAMRPHQFSGISLVNELESALRRQAGDPENEVHNSCGNVFADMGMPDAEARLARYEAKRARSVYSARHYAEVIHSHAPELELASIETMFKAFARDQRHLCAERVAGLSDAWVDSRVREGAAGAIDAAHAAVMNAPEPGARTKLPPPCARFLCVLLGHRTFTSNGGERFCTRCHLWESEWSE